MEAPVRTDQARFVEGANLIDVFLRHADHLRSGVLIVSWASVRECHRRNAPQRSLNAPVAGVGRDLAFSAVREILGVVVVAAAVFVAVGSADSTTGRIVVIPRSPVVGVRAQIEFRGRALLPASRRLILIVSPDTGTAARLRLVRAARGIWRGSFSFPYLGRWRLRVAARRTIL